MKAATLSLLFFSITFTAFADRDRDRDRGGRWDRGEMRVISLAQEVSELTRQNIDTLDRAEVEFLAEQLKLARGILVGEGDHRPYPPRRRRNVCEGDAVEKFQAAFVKVRDMAYSSNGLNYNSTSAKTFALEWAKGHACEDADQYVESIKRLYQFSYASTGLNYNSTGAKTFALDKVEQFCANFDIEQKFKMNYDFAYSSTGLNMNSTGARAYALEKIEKDAFRCRPFEL